MVDCELRIGYIIITEPTEGGAWAMVNFESTDHEKTGAEAPVLSIGLYQSRLGS